MAISKAWLEDKLMKNEAEIQAEMSETKLAILFGRKEAYQDCFNELTKPPLSKEQAEKNKKLKDFDPDKTYEDIVRFYMDKKGYSKEQANEIAQKVVVEQKQKRL